MLVDATTLPTLRPMQDVCNVPLVLRAAESQARDEQRAASKQAELAAILWTVCVHTLPAWKQIFKWLFCGTQHKQDEHQQHQTQRQEKIGISCGPPPKGTNTTMEIRA